MPDDTSVAAAVALLAVLGVLRGGLTYAAGLGARRAGEGRERAQALLGRPAAQRAQALVARWGAPGVVASYLLVGTQTAACLAAGLLRMPARRALPAIVVGALLRAALYVTVGVAVLTAWLGEGPGRWVAAAVVAVLVLGAVVAVMRRRRRRR